ncbi:MAG TPA: HEAT repeat domain-containing protein, partial [Thermoanaerobaculia bacterium]
MSANPELIQQARSSDPDMRQKAAYLVSHSTDAGDFPLMFELLGDKDWRVRKTIVDGFVRDPRGEVIEKLLDALGDPENAGRRNSATEALVRIGDATVPAIVDRLRSKPEADIRLSLVNLLGDLRSEEGFDVLRETLENETDINVASSIISSLGKFRD